MRPAGLDGCSPGALRAVLKTEYPRPGNQFVAPYVHTLVISKPDKPEVSWGWGWGWGRLECPHMCAACRWGHAAATAPVPARLQAPLYRYNHLLYADEAEFVPPSDAEMAAAAPAATGNSSTSDAYHGCAVAKGALWAGNVTGLLQGVASPIDCCRECHARLGPATNGTQPCNLWHYCPANQKGSCIYRLIDRNDTAEADTSLQRNYTLQPGQCELCMLCRSAWLLSWSTHHTIVPLPARLANVRPPGPTPAILQASCGTKSWRAAPSPARHGS